MIQISCEKCDNHCCGQNKHLTPVLLPSEGEKFKKHSAQVETPFGKIWVLAKKKNESCVFLDDKKMLCTIHTKRPLECRLYPFLLVFENDKVGVKLDKRFCPNLETLQFDKKKILFFVHKQNFPEDWIKKYKTLVDL